VSDAVSGDPAKAILAQLRGGGVSGLRARLLSEPPILPMVTTRGDFDLDPHARPPEKRELRPAAVLMPIVQRTEPTVLLTQRTHTLAQHAGQVAFPGGRVEKTDISLVQTALRETQEETGIASTFVTVAGFLDAYETGTGFAILPVVGVVADGFALAPNPDEVAKVFEVPLAFLLDSANRRIESREFQGRTRSFYSFSYDGHYIWGATAAMLVNFGERLRAK
jgi:8-oxo-dGTP pyrophosphatase MutT (NUDIX family)